MMQSCCVLVRIACQAMGQTRGRRTSMAGLLSRTPTKWNARNRPLSQMSRLSKNKSSICALNVARGSRWLHRSPPRRSQPPKARAKRTQVLTVRINSPKSSSQWHRRGSKSPPPSCLQSPNRSQRLPLLRIARPRSSNRGEPLAIPLTTRRKSPIPRQKSMLRWEMWHQHPILLPNSSKSSPPQTSRSRAQRSLRRRPRRRKCL